MALVVASEDIEQDQVNRPNTGTKPGAVRTHFFKATRAEPDGPVARLVEQDAGRIGDPHYHLQDEFQIIWGGKGRFGRQVVTPYSVRFARAYTPYGPLLPDKETGWTLMTLRTHYDPGAHNLADSTDKLKQIPGRRPWQALEKVNLLPQKSGVDLQYVPRIKDDQGLFACALTMAPHTTATAPDPHGGDGQFVVVVKGSLMHDNRERKAPTVAFIQPGEGAFEIHAGPQGLEGIIMNFPAVKPRGADTKTPSVKPGYKKWQCALCSFAYDEALGMPEDGIPAGTRWADVPSNWNCPDCSANKADFEMVEVP